MLDFWQMILGSISNIISYVNSFSLNDFEEFRHCSAMNPIKSYDILHCPELTADFVKMNSHRIS